MTTTRRALASLTAAVAMVLATVLAVVVAPVATPSAGAATIAELLLRAQDFTVAANGQLSLTVEVPATIDAATLDASDLVVTAYRRLTTRTDVLRAMAGDFPAAVDVITTPVATLARSRPDRLALTMPIETNRQTPPGMQLSRQGLYPVLVEVRHAGDTLAELITFVNRLPTDGVISDNLNVAVVMGTSRPLHLDDDGEVALDDDDLDELTALTDAVDASSIVSSVRIEPGVLAALHERDPALARRLVGALQRHDVIAAPSYPLDPSQAAAAGQAPLFTQWLRDGEDLLAADLPAPAVRTSQFVTGTLSQGGATLLRDLGTRLLVTTPDHYDGLRGSLGGFSDPSSTVGVTLDGDAQIEAVVIDRAVAPVLATRSVTPVLTAIEVVAQLLAQRQQVVDADELARHHSIVLGTGDLGIPDPTTLAAITSLVSTTPGLLAADLDDVATRTDRLRNGDRDVIVTLPGSIDSSALERRITLTNDLGLMAASIASMLPDGDPRPAAWNAMLRLFPTTALDDAAVARRNDDLLGQLATIRSAVELPAPFSFSMTGRDTTIRLNLRNNSVVPLTVTVRLDSGKLTFPDGDQVEVLAPRAVTEVLVRVEARSNGDFPVSLNVYTPAGEQLAPTVPLTASLNALSGLGNLVTGAAILMLGAWWYRHWRSARRQRGAALTVERHPVSRGNGIAAAAELSPDAAASTLPPS